MAAKKAEKSRYVVVIARPPGSNWARVIGGTLQSQSEDGTRVTLTGARQALFYERKTAGELGLCVFGPRGSDSRVGPLAPRVDLHGVTFLGDATEPAAKAWESAPTWQG